MMEGHMSGGSLLGGQSYGVMDIQPPLHSLHQQRDSHPHLQDPFAIPIGNLNDSDQQLQSVDFTKGHSNMMTNDTTKACMSDDEEHGFAEGAEGHNEGGKGKENSTWHRMKWTDAMVRLLITIVSYIGDDALAEGGNVGKRKISILQKKGKWKLVSSVMAERRCYVSPQQCEDKFNDLNKRYKRLTDVLGRGTSCKVVENPALLDVMVNLSEKAKEDARRILSSKHLFYEEMCSYHNGNRLHLPSDPSLQRSVHLALRSGEDHRDKRRTSHDDFDEDDQQEENEEDVKDDEVDFAHNCFDGRNDGPHGISVLPKGMRSSGQDVEDGIFPTGGLMSQDNNNRRPKLQRVGSVMDDAVLDGDHGGLAEKQWRRSRMLELEEQKLQIQARFLELEEERLKWQKYSMKKDRELEKLKLENEKMKLENEQMIFKLKRQELNGNYD